MKNKKDNTILIEQMVELYSSNPNITHKEVCSKLLLSEKTAKKMRTDSFWNKVYDRFMTNHQHDLLQVIGSAVKEAKLGNVSAQKLVLQHAGRLTQNIAVKNVKSPYEYWMESKNYYEDDDGNIQDGSKPIPYSATGMDGSDAISYEDEKKRRWLERRKELYRWNKRATSLNIPPMDAKRPTKMERQKWEASIVKAESLLKN